MKRKDEGERRVTRREFMQHSTRVGAGAAVVPLVLQLSACAGDEGGDDTLLDDSPDGGAGEGGSGDDSTAGNSSGDSGDTNVASNGDDRAGGSLASGAVLLGLYAGDGEAAMRAAAASLDFSWLGEGDTVLIKVASNSELYRMMEDDMDIDAGRLLEGVDIRAAGKELIDLIQRVAEGERPKAEINRQDCLSIHTVGPAF